MSISMKTSRELATAPGASVVLHKLTEGRRMKLRALIGEYLAKIRAVGAEIDVLLAAPEDQRDFLAVMTKQDEMDRIQHDSIDPAWIKWGVAAVRGLVVEDVEMGVDQLFDWPSDVYAEVLELVRESASMSENARKNSSSPTTSSEPGGDPQNPLTAALVELGGTS